MADRALASTLVRLRVDLNRIAKSTQKLSERFRRGGNDNLRTYVGSRLVAGDLLAIPNADFYTLRHEVAEEDLFNSYEVYFYHVTKIKDVGTMTLRYAGRIEPLDGLITPAFKVSLNLDRLPRDAFDLPVGSTNQWLVATSHGKTQIQAMFPTLKSSSSGGGGGGDRNRRSGGKDHGGRSSSSGNHGNSGSSSGGGGSIRSTSADISSHTS